MEQLISIATGIIAMTLYVASIAAQNAKRTANRWAKEILATGKAISPETSEIGTIYANPFKDWFLEIDAENRVYILRNQKIRDKIEEYKTYRKLRNVLRLIFCALLGLSFYIFIN